MTLSWHGESIHEQDDVILGHALEAVELDPTDASNFAELGAVQIHLFEFDTSRRSFETAMRLSPHDPQIWAQFGWFMHTVSDPDPALEYLDRAIEADPYPSDTGRRARTSELLGTHTEIFCELSQGDEWCVAGPPNAEDSFATSHRSRPD